MIAIERYHDFSAGHRVVGHEGKCVGLHGHNYRVTFVATCNDQRLDELGRVIDFGVIKSSLCQWLEDNWDHKMLLWDKDPLMSSLYGLNADLRIRVAARPNARADEAREGLAALVGVPFNPTAENMAEHLLRVIGPQQLVGTGVYLKRVTVEETRKCSAVAELD